MRKDLQDFVREAVEPLTNRHRQKMERTSGKEEEKRETPES